jgi:ribosomal protein S18 acetylase RimI-like enzyme
VSATVLLAMRRPPSDNGFIVESVGRRMRLRRATSADSEFAFLTKKTTLGPYIRQVWGWKEDVQRQLHEDRFARRDYQVIQVSGVDVGILVCERQPDHVAVHQLFVLPEHQGQGIGTLCMGRILADAGAAELPVRLDVLKVNQRALRFYHGLGFRSIGETDTHIRMEGRGEKAERQDGAQELSEDSAEEA